MFWATRDSGDSIFAGNDAIGVGAVNGVVDTKDCSPVAARAFAATSGCSNSGSESLGDYCQPVAELIIYFGNND